MIKQYFLNSFRFNNIDTFDAITRVAAMTLWAFIGLETACVNAGVVENPEKTIPIATMLGVLLAGTTYVLSSSVIMGIIPQAELAALKRTVFFSCRKNIGPSAGAFVSICAIIACFGTLSGWTLVMGQIAKAAADDNLFPKFFAFINRNNSPYFGLLAGGDFNFDFLYSYTFSHHW